jgi:hypothetical protein
MSAPNLWLSLALALAIAMPASAQGKAEHDRRAAAELAVLFAALDRDGDRAVSRIEAAGDVNFLPLFPDVDINRDGLVTAEEFGRHLQLAYGVTLEAVAAPSAVTSNASKPAAPAVR